MRGGARVDRDGVAQPGAVPGDGDAVAAGLVLHVRGELVVGLRALCGLAHLLGQRPRAGGGTGQGRASDEGRDRAPSRGWSMSSRQVVGLAYQ